MSTNILFIKNLDIRWLIGIVLLLGTSPVVGQSAAAKPKSHFKMSLEYKLGIQKSKTTVPDGEALAPQPASRGYWNVVFQTQGSWSLVTRFRLFPDKPTNLLDRGALSWRSQAASAPTVKTKPVEWSASLGRDLLRLGGFENQANEISAMPLSTYQEYRLPFRDQSDRRSVDGLVLGSGSPLGKAELQVLKDVRSTTYANSRKEFDRAYGDSKSKRLAGAFQWIYTAKMAGWSLSPLVQAGRYDAMQSKYYGTGFQIAHKVVTLSLDLAQDQRLLRRSLEDSLGAGETPDYVQTRFGTLQGSLVLGAWQPFIKGSQFTTVQPGLDQIGNRDATAYDDQSLDAAMGTHWNLGKVKPYGWVQWQRQKVIDQPRNPLVSSAVVTQRIELGIFGEI